LNKLFQDEKEGSTPNFNFFKTYSYPLTSHTMKKLASYRTVREQQEMFRPLERQIAKELDEQQVELLVSGIYAASECPDLISFTVLQMFGGYGG